jgi:hypothetical protein
LLINIFFGGIITIGLNRFLFDFLLIEEKKLYLFDIPILFDFLFFITAFFWVVSQWVIYHESITKYPYGIRYSRFFIDILRFSLMFIILNTSFFANTRFSTLIISITIWHIISFIWHWWNRDLESDISIHLRVHLRSIISYAIISIIFIFLQFYPYSSFKMIINLVIMAITIGCMIIFNALRLQYFLIKPK